MTSKAAIGLFLNEFSKLETVLVSVALRSLSRDPMLIENATSLLDLNARLKLLERLGFARSIPGPLMEALQSVSIRIRNLSDQRRAIALAVSKEFDDTAAKARGAGYLRVSQMQSLMPALPAILSYGVEAVALQDAVRAISEKFDHHRPMRLGCC